MVIWRRGSSPPTSERLSQRCPANHITAATPAKISHAIQTLREASDTTSPPAIGLPGPGSLGIKASVAGRQAESAQDASQASSLRNVSWSAVKFSQSAAGALSLETLASILLLPVRRYAATSAPAISFQFRPAAIATGVPLILNSARLAARSSSRATPGWSVSVNSRRKTVSRLAMRCAPASIALGKRIHSARPSRDKKLISGLRVHDHASHPMAIAASTRTSVHLCQILRSRRTGTLDALGGAFGARFERFARILLARFTRPGDNSKKQLSCPPQKCTEHVYIPPQMGHHR